MDTRKLATRVAVNGRWYGPEDGEIPADVAGKITNPKAWAADTDTGAEPTVEPGTSSGVRLATRVNVNGRWYGPEDEIPDDVAAQVRNPKAWAGGKVPSATPAGEVQGEPVDPNAQIAAANGESAESGAASTGDTNTGGSAAEEKPRKVAPASKRS